MYPQPELIRLAAHKAALRRDIAGRRAQCASAAAGMMQPIEWLDRMLAAWRRLSPFARLAAVPLGCAIKQLLFRRSKLLGSLVSWGPLVASVIRGVGSPAATRRRRGKTVAPTHG